MEAFDKYSNPDTWAENKKVNSTRIVVTGSNGFVGQVLVKRLEELGHEVLGIDLPTDIRDKSYLNREPGEFDVMIHLAGVSSDREAQKNPYECFDINVIGTLNTLRMSQICKVKQFIFASSEWVYGDSEVEKDEGAFINTMTLGEYALSKHVSEVNLLQNYVRTGLPTTILRFGIIYGPKESNFSVVENLFNAVKEQNGIDDQAIKVGSLKTGRHYIHVEDIVSGIVKSIGLTGYHIINLEGDDFVSLQDIIDTSIKVLRKEEWKITESNSKSPSIRKIKNTKAKIMLGWKPEYNLTRGLESLLKGEIK